MEPDQGLRYELAAMIGSREALSSLARVHPDVRVLALDVPGLALLPVLETIAADTTPAALCSLDIADLPGGTPLSVRRRQDLITGPESGFEVLTPGLAALIEAASTIDAVAYVEADYLGRDGRQAAAVWQAGRLVLGPLLHGRREAFEPGTAPISLALRGLGLHSSGSRDEFVLAGLGRYRRTAEWAIRGPNPMTSSEE